MLEADNVELKHDSHGDAGQGFNGNCPKCGWEIHVAESQWWESKCSCGYVWHLELRIVTDEDEES